MASHKNPKPDRVTNSSGEIGKKAKSTNRLKRVLINGFPAMMLGVLSLVMMFGTSVTMAPESSATAKAQSDAQSEALSQSSQSGTEGAGGSPDVDEEQAPPEEGAQSDQVAPVAPRLAAKPEVQARIAGTHTIIVKTGAYRTGISATDINSLNTAGVRFELRVGSATGALAGVANCEIQAADPGSCVFEGVPKDGRTYYAVEIAPAPGSPAASTFSEPLTHLGLGTGTTTAYAYSQTVSSGGADQTYTIPQLSANTDNATTASSGFVANRVKNPLLEQSCNAGVRVAIVLDTSGSVDGWENDLASATSSLIDGLVGTPSSVALFSFARISPGGVPNTPTLMPVSTQAEADAVKNIYAFGPDYNTARFNPTGGTNWDNGMFKVAQGSGDINKYDIAFVLTDGNPTYSGRDGTEPLSGPGNSTSFRELERAVLSANAVKATGTRIITVGMGDSGALSDYNLESISGHTQYAPGMRLNQFDYIRSGWDQLEQILKDFAAGLSCEANVTVVKETQAEPGLPWTPTAGWGFGITQTGASSTTPTGNQTTGADGSATWKLTFTDPDDQANVMLTETPQPDWNLTNIVCNASGTTLDVANNRVSIAGVGVGSNVTCTFSNQKAIVNPDATVSVGKDWVINGGSPVEDGEQPSGFAAQLTLDPLGSGASTTPAWGETRTGFVKGQSVTIGETMTLPTGCAIKSQTISGPGIEGTAALPAEGQSVTLPDIENSYQITNEVECQQLTLVKEVNNSFGPVVDGSAWNQGLLANEGEVGALTFDSGEAKYVPIGAYALSEVTKDGYESEGLACVGGTFEPATQTVSIAAGESAVCTFTNTDLPGSATWSKVASGTGDALAGSQWTLTGPDVPANTVVVDCVEAPCPAGDFTDQNPAAGQLSVAALKWGSYSLSEFKAPPGYELDDALWGFAISASALDFEFEEGFVNTQRPGPSLPLTGGISRDLIYAAGATLALLGAGAFGLNRLRIRKLQ